MKTTSPAQRLAQLRSKLELAESVAREAETRHTEARSNTRRLKAKFKDARKKSRLLKRDSRKAAKRVESLREELQAIAKKTRSAKPAAKPLKKSARPKARTTPTAPILAQRPLVQMSVPGTILQPLVAELPV